jgi:hypothetical protein
VTEKPIHRRPQHQPLQKDPIFLQHREAEI